MVAHPDKIHAVTISWSAGPDPSLLRKRRIQKSHSLMTSRSVLKILGLLLMARICGAQEPSATIILTPPPVQETSTPTRNSTLTPSSPAPVRPPPELVRPPSPAPASPTRSPTQKPTTRAPTQAPRPPTRTPTRVPTEKPAPAPTPVPAPPPTRGPTQSPVKAPTLPPTTRQITQPPTSRPSRRPTTPEPTLPLPTRSPTLSPTKSHAPTDQPSKSPTVSPKPTPKPSALPSLRPTPVTFEPTVSPAPTKKPSRSPSQQPTVTRSSGPTNVASNAPSPFASQAPSGHPTLPMQEVKVDRVKTRLSFARAELNSDSIDEWELATQEHIEKSVSALDLGNATPSQLEVLAKFEHQKLMSHTDPFGPSGRRSLQETMQDLRPLDIWYRVIFYFRSPEQVGVSDVSTWLGEAFNSNEDRAAYVSRLKETQDPAFADVQKVEVLVNGTRPEEEAEPASSGGKNSSMLWIIIGAAGGGFLVLLVVAYFVCRRRVVKSGERPKEAPTATASVTDTRLGFSAEILVDKQDDVSTLGDPVLGQGAMLLNGAERDERTASVGDDYDYAKQYLQAHGITETNRSRLDSSATPTRVSSSNSAFSKSAGLGPMGASVFSDDASFEQQYTEIDPNSKFDVDVPPGKLGMVIDTPNGGVPVVHAIKSESVLSDRVHVGDRLISVDGEDVTGMTAVQVSKLISLKSDQQRLLVFVRSRTRLDDDLISPDSDR